MGDRDLRAVGQGRDIEISEDGRSQVGELAQTGNGEPTNLHVGVFAGPHRDEVSPGPVVPGDDDPGLRSVGQHGPGGLACLLAPQHRVGNVGQRGFQFLQQLDIRRAAGICGLTHQRDEFRVVLDSGGSTTFESSSGTNRWESCEYEKWRCRINSWVQDREIPVI